jgi:hypothetical protein
MKKATEKSEINLLTGKISFTNEPLWYRIIIILLVAGFIIGSMWAFKTWIIPFLLAGKLSNFKLFNLLNPSMSADQFHVVR